MIEVCERGFIITGRGGIDVYQYSNATILNNTIHGNTASDKGAGIACRENSTTTIVNTILSDNDAQEGPEIWIGYKSDPSTLTISYSNVEGGQSSVYVESGCILNWGPGMIDADPLFLDPLNGDFHLTYASPCIDSGDNYAPSIPAKDFEGEGLVSWFQEELAKSR